MLNNSGTGIHWVLVGDRHAIVVDLVHACARTLACVPAVPLRNPRRGLDPNVRKDVRRSIRALWRAVTAGKLTGGDVCHGGARHGVPTASRERATLAWLKFNI